MENEKTKGPLFMLDQSEKDGKAEIVMDYCLSWFLRCAQDDVCLDKPKLKNRCRFMLNELLGGLLEDDDSIFKVEVWKESAHIDLWVTVVIQKANGKDKEKHAIMIENKYYTGLHLSRDTDGEYRNQLVVYKKKFDAYYDESWILHHCVITCMYRNNPHFDALFGEVGRAEELQEFSMFSLDDLLPDLEETESDIYNEFMLKDWC